MAAPNTFKQLVSEATAAAQAATPATLEAVRTEYLGRKGKLNQAMGALKQATPAQRAKLGKQANAAKAALEKLFVVQPTAPRTGSRQIDITLPGEVPELGHRHPVSLVSNQIKEIFASQGYYFADGPEVENDWNNFEALNIPPDHPGRDMQDTFYIAGSDRQDGTHSLLPRTQGTAVTARELKAQEPPIRMFTIGRVYRNETEDATHGAVFHQIDALMIEPGVSFSNLKATLTGVVRELLGADATVRFRPSYFPFTEPSAEVDVSMPSVRNGEWLELAGSGMIHPQVLRNAGLDPKKHQGFAFAFGIERIAMLKYGLQDLRPFYKPDIRLLRQF